MIYYDYDSYSYNKDYYDDPAVRDDILREAAEQLLWETPETLPEDLLEDF
jgi:hypothetical protein